MPAFLNNASNKLGSVANDALGKGLNTLTGLPSQDIPLYEDFLYKILADANNALTEPSYWVVFFTRLPNGKSSVNRGGKKVKKSLKDTVKGAVSGYVSSQFGIEGKSKYDSVEFKTQIDPGKWVQGAKTAEAIDKFYHDMESTMMLVQGIEIPGDGFSINRDSGDFNAGGFLKPPMTGMRNDTPEMNITFLENNSSVSDLVLRPWVIESSYRSLKFANKVAITCYNLTRSPSGFRIRKQFTFHNACAISIDSEQYDYGSSGGYGKRQIKFVFTHYDLNEGDDMKDGLLASIGNMVGQKVRKALSNVVEGATDVVAGAANQVVTNVVGQFSDAVSDHVQDVQSRIREYGKNAENSLIDKSASAINNAIGFNPDSDSIFGPGLEFSKDGVDNNPAPRIEIPANADDRMNSPPVPPRSKKVVDKVTYDIRDINPDDTPVVGGGAKYTLRLVKANDTPDSSDLKLQHVNINSEDTSIGGINITPVTINDSDTVGIDDLGLQSVNINSDDTSEVINATNVTVDGDDVVDSGGLTLQSVNINSDDTSEVINATNVTVDGDDVVDSGGLTLQSVNINSDDESNNIASTIVDVDSDDTANVSALQIDNVAISNSSEGPSAMFVPISNNDVT